MGLKPKNIEYMNFYECFDLTKNISMAGSSAIDFTQLGHHY